MKKQISFDKSMLRKAFEIAEKSPALKRKVGAIIIDNKDNILSTGFNRMFDELKQINCENEKGDSYECVIHAEEDAIMNLIDDQIPNTIYITFTPCMNCSKLIARSGIKRIVCGDSHNVNFDLSEIKNGYSPRLFLSSMGIEIVQYKKEEIYSFKSDEKIALIHHNKDADGLMSAYLFDMIYQKELEEGSANLIGYNYEKSADWMLDETYTTFIFGDVSPTINWLKLKSKEIENGDIKIIIYDHHEKQHTDILALGLTKILYYYYPQYSGAKIIYKYLLKPSINGLIKYYKSWRNYSSELKIIIDFISFYDTWRFNDDEFDNRYSGNDKWRFTKNSILCFHSYIELLTSFDDFKNFINKLKSNFDGMIDKVLDDGAIIIEKIKSNNQHLIKSGKFCTESKIFIFEGYPNYWMRDQIKEKYPDMLYLLGFKHNLNNNLISFSIRSEEKEDCALIASKFKGGGHNKAAGFGIDAIEAINLLKEPYMFLSCCIPKAVIYENEPIISGNSKEI